MNFDDSDHPANAHLRLAFLDRYWRDREEGTARPLRHYLALFPGHEETVAAEFLSLERSRRREEPSDAADQDGRMVGPYRLVRELGRGGQGVVHLAIDTRLGREVALKILNGLAADTDERLRRFRREAEAASRLEHPGICVVHDAGLEGGVPYIAMSYVRGETLAARLAKRRREREPASADDPTEKEPLRHDEATTPRRARIASREQIEQTLRLFEKIARALHAAHEAGVIHRDIKPGNIMVSTGGDPVILDFGLAKLEANDTPSLTGSGDLFGTPSYMAPEHLSGGSFRPDRRTDIWSLGVSLYEALTLESPFEAATREGLFRAILEAEPLPARRRNRAIDRDLGAVLQTALAKEPNRRYQSAALLADDLRRAAEGAPTLARPLGPVARLARSARRHPARTGLLLMLLIGLPLTSWLFVRYLGDREHAEAARRAARDDARDRHFARASLELAEGRSARALAELRQAATLGGETSESLVYSAVALIALGDRPAAAQALERHDATFGAGPASIMTRAELARLSGQPEVAEALVAASPPPVSAVDHHLVASGSVLAGERGDPTGYARGLRHATLAVLLSTKPRLWIYQQLANAAAKAKEQDLALATATALRTLWPDDAAAHFWAGLALSAFDGPELLAAALDATDTAARLTPTDPYAVYNHAFVLHKLGRHEESLARHRQALAVEADFGPSLEAVAAELVELRRFGEAALAAELALRRGRRSAMLLSNYGSALDAVGQREDAIRHLSDAVALDPSLAIAHFNLGNVLAAAGRHDEALAAYREAKRRSPDNADLLANLGLLLTDLGRHAEARTELEAALLANPASFEAQNNLSIALRALGEIDGAIAAGRAALRLRPGSGDAHFNLGAALQKKGDAEEAIVHFRACLTAMPGDQAAVSSLGACLAELGRNSEAVDTFATLVRARPEDVAAHFRLATGLAALHRHDEAVAAYAEAIRLRPDYAEAHCNLGRSLQALGRFGEALESLRRGHELGIARPGWSYPSGQWLGQAQELADGEAELLRHLAAKTRPENPERLASLAQLAAMKRKSITAVTWFSAAFEQDPSLANDLGRYARFYAARAALRILAGDSEDTPVDDATRADAARRALAWLEADVEAIEERLDSGRLDERRAARLLWQWPVDAVISPILRGESIPAIEPERWRSLGRRVAAILANEAP